MTYLKWIYLSVPMTIFMFGLIGCGHSNHSGSVQSQMYNLQWSEVRLTDLPDQPTIAVGRDQNQSIDFVHIQEGTAMQNYEVDGRAGEPTLIILSPTEAQLPPPNMTVTDAATNAKAIQNYIMILNYSMVDRCRYSKAWRALASVDMREMGPLMLRSPVFETFSIFRSWNYGIDIDQKTFRVVGITGLQDEILDGWQYESAFTGDDQYLFGLQTRSTSLPRDFGVFCQTAYDKFVNGDIAYKLPNFIGIIPPYESKISKDADLEAKVQGDNMMSRHAYSLLEDLPDEDGSFLSRYPGLSVAAKLIQIAKSKKRIGLTYR